VLSSGESNADEDLDLVATFDAWKQSEPTRAVPDR
jgi:hypothetical protein